jgi:MazG family protein
MGRDSVVEQLGRLYDLTRKLREECPWDRKQTQESIIAYTVEETYELADTIAQRAEHGDAAVRGELGDLLFQVYFLACVAEEQGLYDLGEVAAGIHAKLVRRHPHIFGEAIAETPEAVRQNWEVIKREAEGREGIFHDIPDSFPSTLLAQKLQQRAAAVGFDWEHAHEVMAKIKEETAEVEEELARAGASQGGPGTVARAGSVEHDRLAAEIGDLLFAVVNLARKLRVDPELALRGSSLRFRERVEAAERAAGVEGLVFGDLALEQQETYYQRAKKEQKR